MNFLLDLSRRSRENCLQKEITFYLLFLIVPECPSTRRIKFICLTTSPLSPFCSYIFSIVSRYIPLYSIRTKKKTQMNPFTKAEITSTTNTILLATLS
jgi:hypothetical protein